MKLPKVLAALVLAISSWLAQIQLPPGIVQILELTSPKPPFHSITNRNSIKEPADKLTADLYKATFALYGTQTWGNKSETRFLCTATIYQKTPDGYLLLSAGHCVKGKSLPKNLTFSVAEDESQTRFSVTVVKSILDRSTNMDFTVFEWKTAREYPVFNLDIPMNAAVGDDVIIVHFSSELGKQLSDGKIASQIFTDESSWCDICRDNFYITMTNMGPGSSGSAVVSKKTGKIVGITVGTADSTMIIEPISRFSVFVVTPEKNP